MTSIAPAPTAQPDIARRVRLHSAVLAVVAGLVSTVVLCGWGLDIKVLRSVDPGWTDMKANLALGVLLVAIGAWARVRDRWPRVIDLVGGAALILGVVTVLQDIAGASLGIDQLLVDDPIGLRTPGAPGRMAPNSALALMLLGGGVILVRRGRRAATVGQALAVGGGLLGLAAVYGYLYGVYAMYGIERFTAMAFPAGVALTATGASLALGRTDMGIGAILSAPGAGGLLVRRFLPLAVLAPLALDPSLFAAPQLVALSPAAAAGLHTTAVTVAFVALLLFTARAIERHDGARRSATNEVVRQEKQYRELFSNMDAGFGFHTVIFDERGEPIDFVYEDVNDAFEAMTGLSREHVVGKRVTEALPGIESDPADWIGRFGHVAKTGETDRFEQHSQVLDRWYSVLAYRPRPGTFATIFTDVTEERENHKRIERLNAALGRRTAELAEANAWLESFNYSVSHDLRAPLRAIDGFSEAVLEDHGEELPEEARHYLDRVRAGAQKMGQLIDDLLQLSRVGRAEMSIQDVDLGSLAEEAIEPLRDAEPEREVDLEIRGPLEARADPRLARVVMANLIGNAWKFTKNEPRARIEVGAEEHDGERRFYVRDNGAGFDPGYAHKLFGAFQRLHSDKEFGGTGIGLATVQRIVRRHGGRVWAEGAPGEGATFRFTLAPTTVDAPVSS